MAPLVEVRGVGKTFLIPSVRRQTVREHVLGLMRPPRVQALRVLQDVSFSLERGQALGIMGRNGSGKSTLLKVLCGIYRPDAGVVSVSAPLTPLLELGLGWNPELDAPDNVLLIATAMGMSLREAQAAVGEILDFAGLTEFAGLALKHYSSGMAARLGYAVAFAAVREILVLDEVFAVGDAGFRERCEERYQQLRRAGHTIVLVSHDPATVADYCDRALLMEQGRVVMDGDPAEVAEEYARTVRVEPAPASEGGGTGVSPLEAAARTADLQRALLSSSTPLACLAPADGPLDQGWLDEARRALVDDPGLVLVGRPGPGRSPGECQLADLLRVPAVARPVLFRARPARVAGGFDLTLSEPAAEWDLWISLLKRGGRARLLGPPASGAGPDPLELLPVLMQRHAATFRRHLMPLALAGLAELCEWTRRNYELERALEDRAREDGEAR